MMITITGKNDKKRIVESPQAYFLPPWIPVCPDLSDTAIVAASMLFSYKSDPRCSNADVMNLTVDNIAHMLSGRPEGTTTITEESRKILRELGTVGILCDYRSGPLRITDDDHAPLNMSIHEFPVNGYLPPFWTANEALAAARAGK
ncbi:hypothetical protein ABT282_08725 [Streptomyces sp. NPDC000927]|uniref:hypothetical protein n=1 Tax=Streptomyces sp. NPDC000927 TaxID=3154371 RepID=UPI0033169F14